MIVKVEIEAGPELKKLLEELLRGIGKPEKTGEPIAKEVIEHCARIKEKIVVPTSLIKKEKPIEYRDCPLNERKELRNRGTELLKDNRPREVQTKLKEELNVHIPVKTIHTWWNTVKGGVSARLRRDENGKEKPSLILQKQSPEKRAEIKARAMELLKDNKPMEAWKKLSEEYPEIYINDGNLYHWRKESEVQKKAEINTTPSGPTKKFGNPKSKKSLIKEAIGEIPKEPEKPEPTPSATPTPTEQERGPESLTDDEYSHLKEAPKKILDLQIIERKVICPEKGKAVNIAICQTGCMAYRTMIKHYDDGEPYVRCTKAGSA